MKKLYLLTVALIAVFLTSCNQKDLCDDHWSHVPKLDFNAIVDWQLDWEYTYPGGPDWISNWDADNFGMTYDDLRPTRPDGIRILVYNPDGVYTVSNMSPTGGKIFMTEGEHQLLFYNNDTEYIVFNNMNSTATAMATTRAVSRTTFNAFGGPVNVPGADHTVNAPDPLFGHYIEDFTAERSPEQQTLSFTMKPLVFSYLVRYHFSHGLDYVGIARGALFGMASTVYLTDGHTAPETATVLYDCTIKDGYIEAVVHSFGAPDFPNPEYSRIDRPYGLNLEVRLKNGKLLNYNFDISSQMALQPRGGVIEVYGVEVSDADGQPIGGSGGFDVTVEGWGDYIDVPIIM